MIPTKRTITETAREAINEDPKTREAVFDVIRWALDHDLETRGSVRYIASTDDRPGSERNVIRNIVQEEISKERDRTAKRIQSLRKEAEDDRDSAKRIEKILLLAAVRIEELEKRAGIPPSEARRLADRRIKTASSPFGGILEQMMGSKNPFDDAEERARDVQRDRWLVTASKGDVWWSVSADEIKHDGDAGKWTITGWTKDAGPARDAILGAHKDDPPVGISDDVRKDIDSGETIMFLPPGADRQAQDREIRAFLEHIGVKGHRAEVWMERECICVRDVTLANLREDES